MRETCASGTVGGEGGNLLVYPATSHQFLSALFGEDVHAKRVYSLANATLGVISSASLAVNTIGQGLALARGRLTKHAIKQVDRMLSNPGIDVGELTKRWVPYVVGQRPSIVVAMDWTDFDADNQATIMLSLVSKHGRSTPLLWLTVDKATLKNHRNAYEYRLLEQLAEALPADVNALIVADRGFGDQKLYRFLTEELKFDYLIRFRGNIAVTSAESETRPAADWVGVGGRPRTLRNASVTAESYQVGTVVCVHAKDMKEPWCLAASTTTDTAKQLMTTYGKRWGIESGFRDTKDLRFGMGMASIRVSTPERRDRLWLLNAFAVVLLTLLGAAGEALGYDRHLKSNTSKTRTHSLFRQGAMLYDLIPMMPEPRLRPLVERFGAMLLEIPAFAGFYGVI
jgi:Transposase DDE domain